MIQILIILNIIWAIGFIKGLVFPMKKANEQQLYQMFWFGFGISVTITSLLMIFLGV